MTCNAVKAAEISLAKSMAQQLAVRQYPREQRGAGVDSGFREALGIGSVQDDPDGMAEFVRRELPFGGSACPGRGRGGRRVPRLAVRELDQRGKCAR